MTYTRVYANFLRFLFFFCPKRVVFLPEITDYHRDEGDHHLTWRRIPTEGLDTQFEAEIIDRQIDGYDEYVA